MSELNKNIGKRLKQIRHFFNEGRKLSAEQFGHLLGESRDNITNYESGRAGLPVRVIYELFLRGISPTFVVTGEGDVFADNFAGRDFAERLSKKNTDIHKIVEIKKVDVSENPQIKVIKVAAGRIKKNEN